MGNVCSGTFHAAAGADLRGFQCSDRLAGLLGRRVVGPPGVITAQPGAGSADMYSMSTSAINNLSSSYLQQLLASALQNAGTTSNSNPGNIASPSTSDSSQLSPFAQLAGTLQQLQESDPTKYKQVTQQVAVDL